MASFSAVHPSTRHPSSLSPSVLIIPPSFLSSLHPSVGCLSLWSGGNDRTMPCGNIATSIRFHLTCQHQPPPLILPLLFPIFILMFFPSSPLSFHQFFLSFLLLPTAGWAPRRCVESYSVWCLAAVLFLCTTSLHHANLWLALHRGLLTTHACLHATRSEWRRLHSH